MLEVSPLLHVVATHAHDAGDLDEVARRVGADLGRPVSAASVAYLVDHKLVPLGIASTGTRQAPSSAPALALTVRAGVVPAPVVRVVTTVLRPLFLPPVVVAVVLGLVSADLWLLRNHDTGGAARDLVLQPALLLLVVGLTVAAALFHELGHATASRYGGAEPGVIGAGVYLFWPVFYNDLNDSYRLTRGARLRADLGGVYFNAVVILLLAGLYGATGFQPLLVAIVVQHLAIAQQFIPFIRLDGYYIVSDLAGVPDLFARIRPVFCALARRRRPALALGDLTPRARRIVTVWAVLTLPLLTGLTLLLLTGLPSLLAGAWGSAGIQAVVFVDAVGDGAPMRAALSAVQIIFLAVPLVGLSGVLLAVARRCRRPRTLAVPERTAQPRPASSS